MNLLQKSTGQMLVVLKCSTNKFYSLKIGKIFFKICSTKSQNMVYEIPHKVQIYFTHIMKFPNIFNVFWHGYHNFDFKTDQLAPK